MIQYTTPTQTFRVKKIDITPYKIYLTFTQGNRRLTKTGDDLTVRKETVGQDVNTLISVMLSQQETAFFRTDSYVYVKVNWIDSNGVRGSSKTAYFSMESNLLDEVISYDD